MSRPDGLDLEAFAKDFLDAYLENGFLAMPKKEIDLTILELLIKHHETWNLADPPTAFQLAQQLRAKRQRVRSMLDEISFRNAGDDEWAKKRLRDLLVKSERDVEGNKVKIEIEDGYIREYAKSLVRKHFGIVDTSFNQAIVTVSGQKFMLLVAEVMPEDARKKIEDELRKHRDQLKPSAEGKSLLRLFLENFVISAGKEGGQKSVRLAFAAATSGLSEIPGIIRSFFRNGDNEEAEE